MEKLISSVICQRCSECCRNFPFIELSRAEIHKLEELTGLSPDKFTNPKGQEPEGYFLQFKENGDCFFLNKTTGGYFCSVYEARPLKCRAYPSRTDQNEACQANREMILTGLARSADA
ncbi:MAG: YkgJ family cysteine cluster protein [Candidatus Erginobacter occultus]|nr:YkgJ family cysteine cluster protein [Candidatus Erginobacter occultus]